MKRLLSRVRLLLIGVALLLSGCSALRLAYDNGTQLAWWWLDGYIDFPAAAAPQVKEHIGGWFSWHRETQLADYADWLAQLRVRALKPITPAQACSLNDELRARLQPAVDRAITVAAELVPSLGAEQVRHLEERMRKGNLELRDEFAHSDPAERRERAVRRAIDRFERFYGRLGEAQRKVIAARVLSSPFDPEAWIAERERRQADTLRALRQLQAERAAPAQAATALRQLWERAERSPDAAYRAYQRQLTDDNCAFAAEVHNAATGAQRRQLASQFKAWEDDLRQLAARAAATAATAAQ